MKKLIKIQLILAVPLLLAGGFFAYFIFQAVTAGDRQTPQVSGETEEVIYRVLDGMPTVAGQENLLPVAVMIENQIDSRPPAGLAAARVVYEVLAEAAITRFLALYDLTENLEKIGPVRSARPYFADLAGEYGAIYAHSGGSPAALSLLRGDSRVFNLDEFANASYFYRYRGRLAPHNLYTSSELLLAAKEYYELTADANFAAWKFKDGTGSGQAAEDIAVNYSETPTHQVVWKYLPATNRYERWQNNSRHLDESGEVIEAANVIVQYAITKVLDEEGRKRIDLTGEGRATVYRDGLIIDGSWRKDGDFGRTVFYDPAGNEIELNRGKTWIQIVPENK